MKRSIPFHPLSGVYAAALTPLDSHFAPVYEQVPALLHFLADQGCHGALLLGTTGEGPSFSPRERTALCQVAATMRSVLPDFKLLAGTGTPSLDETIALTRTAFELDFDGVVVLPPYYFRTARDEGLFRWFDLLIRQAVPNGKYLLGYHIPQLSGVAFSPDLLARLIEAHPGKFAGLKDSSGDLSYCQAVRAHFGDELLLLTGNDRLLAASLQLGAQGCITAMANLYAPLLRQVWQAFLDQQPDDDAQEKIHQYRQILEQYQPFAPSLKALLAHFHAFPHWAVRPPLLPLAPDRQEALIAALTQIA
jgi:4-hydroxy-tetrahydrodipicolinate synthase